MELFKGIVLALSLALVACGQRDSGYVAEALPAPAKAKAKKAKAKKEFKKEFKIDSVKALMKTKEYRDELKKLLEDDLSEEEDDEGELDDEEFLDDEDEGPNKATNEEGKRDGSLCAELERLLAAGGAEDVDGSIRHQERYAEADDEVFRALRHKLLKRHTDSERGFCFVSAMTQDEDDYPGLADKLSIKWVKGDRLRKRYDDIWEELELGVTAGGCDPNPCSATQCSFELSHFETTVVIRRAKGGRILLVGLLNALGMLNEESQEQQDALIGGWDDEIKKRYGK
jgi:hypothetical protein